jgi:hypothetical protein
MGASACSPTETISQTVGSQVLTRFQIVDGARQILGPRDDVVPIEAGGNCCVIFERVATFLRALVDGIDHCPSAARNKIDPFQKQVLAGTSLNRIGAGEENDRVIGRGSVPRKKDVGGDALISVGCVKADLLFAPFSELSSTDSTAEFKGPLS